MSNPNAAPTGIVATLETRVAALEAAIAKDVAWARAHAVLTLVLVAALANVAGVLFHI
ncbi:MAG: hypothetical protein ACP5QR_04950 [Rhizomicrobium sp.]